MKSIITWSVLFLLLFAHEASYAQSFNFRNYQVENGLSYNSVISSMQDKKGFMWFGTKDGLNRFDGYSFKVFRHNPNQPGTIGNNFIQCLYEDADEGIWVGTLDGLYRYDPFKETFIFIDHTRNMVIRDIKGDKDANIWYIESGTVCRYSKRTDRVTTYGGQGNSLGTSLAITAGNVVYVSTENGFIQRYDVKNDHFTSYPVFDHSNRPMSKRIEKIYDTGSDVLLVGTLNQGLKLFNTRTNSYQDVVISNADQTPISIRDFIASGSDEYWIASESGIFVYQLKTGKYRNLRHQFNDPYSISDNAVYTLTRDREGGIWAGTYFGGVNYFPNQYTPFEKYFPQAAKQTLTGKAVREICSDNYGNIWIGTEDAGLNKFDPKSGSFKNFSPNGLHTSNLHSNIHGLLAVKNELWIGTFEHGLDVMDIPSSKIIRSYRGSQAPNALKSNFIECLLQTSAGNILIGTSSGLYCYNPKSDDFQLLNDVPGNLHYTALMEDKTGNIWAGTLRDGLYLFNPVSGRQFSYKHEFNNPQSLSTNDINGLFQDSDGTIWITTESGLLRLNADFKSFTRYASGDGFPSDVFYKILEGAKHELWLSTSKGLVKFNSKANKISIFSRANGLLSDQFNYSSAFREHDGKMYFGSVKGLIRFDPEQFQENNHAPPLFFTGFQVNNKDLTINEHGSLKQSINSTDHITLNYDQSTFSIDFAALSYTAPEITEYAYILEGLEKNWTYLKGNRKVYFTQLLPGIYTFKLKAANSSGNWNDQVKTLTITVRPPFWASIWAFLIYIGSLFAGLYYGIRYYHKWLHHRNEIRIERWEAQKEKELYQAKINFFTYVTHEIRTPLTLIKGPLEDISKKTADNADLRQDIYVMQKNTDRLLDLTDQLLDFRKTESKGFSLNFIYCNINQILLDNFIRFKSAAEERGLLTTINLPENPAFAYADPEALNKILSNLIDNASKYAVRQIWIQLEEHESTFSIQVSSDGNKIPQAQGEKIFEPFYRINDNKMLRGSGIGLPLARSLSELHEGSLTLSSESDDRNTFVLTLPLHHAQEFKLPDLKKESTLLQKTKPDARDADSPIILLVEDNVEISTFISSKLESEYKVLQASNGVEALTLLSSNHVQLIISDIMMPLMNGIDLCQKLKSDLEFAHIPIILLTARNTLQSKIEGLEAGADAYLEKPFSPEHLLTQVSNLLVSREKIKSYFASSPLVHIKSMAYNKSDEMFLEKLNECIKKNIDNSALDVDFLANAMCMSKPTLYRKIKAISDLTPHELINITRLKNAAELLLEGQHKILKIASMTGFSSQAQFSRSFAKQFGMTPSECAASVKAGKDR